MLKSLKWKTTADEELNSDLSLVSVQLHGRFICGHSPPKYLSQISMTGSWIVCPEWDILVILTGPPLYVAIRSSGLTWIKIRIEDTSNENSSTCLIRRMDIILTHRDETWKNDDQYRPSTRIRKVPMIHIDLLHKPQTSNYKTRIFQTTFILGMNINWRGAVLWGHDGIGWRWRWRWRSRTWKEESRSADGGTTKMRKRKSSSGKRRELPWGNLQAHKMFGREDRISVIELLEIILCRWCLNHE